MFVICLFNTHKINLHLIYLFGALMPYKGLYITFDFQFHDTIAHPVLFSE
jgi:hypothetical protein